MGKAVKIIKIINGVLEICLGIPVLGGLVVIGFFYTPLLIMFVLHIIALILSQKAGVKTTGSILGIVCSCLAWIPVVGMVLHIIAGLSNLEEGIKIEE